MTAPAGVTVEFAGEYFPIEPGGRFLHALLGQLPAVVVEDKYLISGGQPAGYFEQALRQIAAEA